MTGNEIQRMLDDEEDRLTRERQEKYEEKKMKLCPIDPEQQDDYTPARTDEESGEKIIIVSRHQGAIDFVLSNGFNGRIVEQFSPEMAESGMVVIGILPVHLIGEVLKSGSRFIQIQLPEVPREMRGQELTPEQMVQYGAKLVEVEQLVLREV